MNNDVLRSIISQIQTQSCETQTTEVKAAAQRCPEKLYDTLSSFSNQNEGGTILFGLDKSSNHQVVGVYDAQDLQKKVAEQGEEMQPPVRPSFTVCTIDGKKVVAAEIAPLDFSRRPCFKRAAGRLKGSYVRVGEADKPMTEQEVYNFEAYRERIQDVLRTVDDPNVALLDSDLVQEYLRRCRQERPNLSRFDEATQLRLAGLQREGVPTMLALLMLGLDPQSAYPHLRISACHIPGTEMGVVSETGDRFLSSKAICGTLPQMLEDAIAYVRSNMNTGIGIDSATGDRIDTPDYPIEAVREILLNALIHRDYSRYADSRPIQLLLFSDRLEIRSPGGLFGRLSISDLGRSQPEARNSALITAMEMLGHTENRYSGIPRVRRLMSEAQLPEPVFMSRRGKFIVQLYNKRSTKADSRKMGRPADDTKFTSETTDSEHPTEQALLEFCKLPRTRREIASFMGMSSQGYVMRRYVAPLVVTGKLELTLPDKPNSRLQQYVAAAPADTSEISF